MVLGGFVGGFGWFWVVLGRFGWFWVVPCFSNYSRTPLTRTLKGNENLFELAGFRVIGVD